MRHRPASAIAHAALILCIVAVLAPPAFAAGYPRRIAIAPFASLTKEDIGSTVAVLPRLLASRLMALAGAEVLLLPAGGKSPEAAAKEAKYPLLLQGTVSKLGKGYSIDTTVTDLSTGGSAGAFFSAAATEDDIIGQLGVLSGEIAEKVFGVQGAIRAVSPPAPAPVPAAPMAGGAAVAAPLANVPASPAKGSAPVAPVPVEAPSGPWEPRSIVKLGASDKVPDQLVRVAMGDADGDGELEIVALGRRTIYFYKVKGNTVVPFQPTRITRGLEHHFLNVEIFDADGDGKPEILVTDIVNERLQSFVMKYRNGTFEVVATDIPYYIVVLSDVDGKPAMAGQSVGLDKVFSGRVALLGYAGGKMTEGRKLQIPYEDGIFGLNAVRIGSEGQYVYIDDDEHLRLLDGKGKTIGKTKEYFSGARDGVTIGSPLPRQVNPPRTWVRGRVVPLGGEPGSPFLFLRKAEGNRVMKEMRLFDNSRLVIGKYEGTSFMGKIFSETIESLITDAYPVVEKEGRGALVAASVLEETETAMREPTSRVFLYRVQ